MGQPGTYEVDMIGRAIARFMSRSSIALILATGGVRGQSISFLHPLDDAQPSEWAVGIAKDATGIYVVSSVYPGSSPVTTPFLFSKDTLVRKQTFAGAMV